MEKFLRGVVELLSIQTADAFVGTSAVSAKQFFVILIEFLRLKISNLALGMLLTRKITLIPAMLKHEAMIQLPPSIQLHPTVEKFA